MNSPGLGARALRRYLGRGDEPGPLSELLPHIAERRGHLLVGEIAERRHLVRARLAPGQHDRGTAQDDADERAGVARDHRASDERRLQAGHATALVWGTELAGSLKRGRSNPGKLEYRPRD